MMMLNRLASASEMVLRSEKAKNAILENVPRIFQERLAEIVKKIEEMTDKGERSFIYDFFTVEKKDCPIAYIISEKRVGNLLVDALKLNGYKAKFNFKWIHSLDSVWANIHIKW